MSRFTDALDALGQALDADVQQRLKAKDMKDRKWHREQIQNELVQFQTQSAGAIKTLEFCKNCKLKILKPKVSRTYSYRDFSAKGRIIKPQVFLHTKEHKVRLDYLKKLNLVETITVWDEKNSKTSTGYDEVDCPRIPDILPQTIRLTPPHTLNKYMQEVVDAFMEEVGPGWVEIVDKIKTHWAEVGENLDKIVDAYFATKGPKERKIFQDKFAACLVKTDGLIDAPADAILAVFKLGWQEIMALQKFTKRNDADLDLVELEDIVEAQNSARVKTVMES